MRLEIQNTFKDVVQIACNAILSKVYKFVPTPQKPFFVLGICS